LHRPEDARGTFRVAEEVNKFFILWVLTVVLRVEIARILEAASFLTR